MTNINNLKRNGNIRVSFEGKISIKYEGEENKKGFGFDESSSKDNLDMTIEGKVELEGTFNAIVDGIKEVLNSNTVHNENISDKEKEEKIYEKIKKSKEV